MPNTVKFKIIIMKNSNPFKIAVSIFLLTFSACQPKTEILKENLQTKLEEIKTEKHMPGISVAITLPDNNTLAFTSGYSDTLSENVLLPSDRLMAGSIGKSFVAAIILKMVEANEISLDDKISKWFGDTEIYSQIPNANDITIRMLLSHRTGWVQHFFESQNFINDLFAKLSANPDNYFSPIEIFNYVTYDQALFPADSTFHYSDMNYIALGNIIEKETGKNYYDILQESILTPFELRNTIPANKRELESLVNGYINPADPMASMSPTAMQNGALVFNPSIEFTGGGLASNPSDLSRWAKILWNAEFLNNKSVQELTTIYGSEPKFGIEGYGFGTEIWQTELGILYGHTGYYTGYNSIMGYFPEYNVAIAVQINRDYNNGDLTQIVVDLAKVAIDFINK